MPRRKNPFQADNAGPASGPSQVTMAASGALAGASVDQGEGLAEQMNQRMAKQFGIGGLSANTDPALEREADVLGQQFANAMPDISGGVGTFGGTPSATDAAAPIQMAGHKGSKSSALKKEHKMRENDDARSETARYGLRDSDEIQKGINPLRKFMAGQRIDTLSATKEQVKGGRYRAVPTAAMSARSSRT